MVQKSIRPIAIALMSWNGKILVFEGYDKIREEFFYRPLGGGIDFGEYSRETIRREIMEEIGLLICEIRYLFTLENIFVCDGIPGHEIVQVYDAKLENESLYGKEIDGFEENGEILHCMWKSVEEIQAEGRPLYPEGLPEKLQQKRAK